LQCKPEELATKFTERQGQGRLAAGWKSKDAPLVARSPSKGSTSDVDLDKKWPLLTQLRRKTRPPYITGGASSWPTDPDSRREKHQL